MEKKSDAAPRSDTNEAASIRRQPPPWVMFPHIHPDELSQHLKQGVAEPWFDQEWRPFWSALTSDDKRAYLDHWGATPQWEEALVFFFDESAD